MESNTTAASYFNIFLTGQLESATFPLGAEAYEIFCRYESVAGPDWELVSGLKNGITQLASNRNGNFNDPIVFNMPIEQTYRSTNSFGWPQLLISIYGKTRWGIETSLGYSRVHVPVFGNVTNHSLKASILKPRCSNMMADITTWITGRNPELKDVKVLLDNSKSKECLAKNMINKISMVITNAHTKVVQECWDFKMNTELCDGNTSSLKELKRIQNEIRDVMRQISATVIYLPLLDCICTFDVMIHTPQPCDVPESLDDTEGIWYRN